MSAGPGTPMTPPGLAWVQAPALGDWGSRCLRAVGMSPEDADLLSGSLVQTSLWGVDSHGIARLPHYLERLRRGSIRARPQVRTLRTGPSTAQVHGDQGQGIVIAHQANALAMTLARESGIGAVGVSDSSHCGAMALYTRPAARAGLVAIAFTHADRIAAPQGGYQAFFGTNPISMAFPREGAEPACLDMATTSIPWNQVMNARREGHVLPPGVAVDAHGHPTTDPHAAQALTPLGGPAYGHKGYGLALAIDLLCGPLHGNPYGPHISGMFTELDTPRRLGAFFIVLDPLRFAGGAGLAAAVEAMARDLAAQPGQPRMPGDPQLQAQALREVQGIPLEPGLQAEMRAWSERLDVALPPWRQAS